MLQRHALRVVVSELKNQTLKMRRKCFGDSWPEKKRRLDTLVPYTVVI